MQTYYRSDSGKTFYNALEAQEDEILHHQVESLIGGMPAKLTNEIRPQIYDVLYELLKKGKIQLT
jgi:hypothetical protein